MKAFARLILLLAMFVLAALLAGIRLPPPARVAAAPALQLTAFPTPTPGPDGRILYVVQPGDTLWRISAVTGVSIDELRRLNNLTGEDVIREGQTLILGFGGPSEGPTQPAPAAPTLLPGITPTPTAGPGTGMICILLYEDVNGDAFRQEDEFSIPGGAVSVANRSGTVSLQAETEAGPPDPDVDPPRVCFPDLLEGEYTISVAIPDGYNPTTVLNATLELQAGDETFIDFGAQLSSEGLQAALPPEEGGRSPMLGIVGGVLILGGLGLAFYVLRGGGRGRG